MLRGISGGQKKRVTSGEVMVGPMRVLYADEVRLRSSEFWAPHAHPWQCAIFLLQPLGVAQGLQDMLLHAYRLLFTVCS